MFLCSLSFGGGEWQIVLQVRDDRPAKGAHITTVEFTLTFVRFPRHYRKGKVIIAVDFTTNKCIGMQMDMQEIHNENRAREAYAAMIAEERAAARARGEDPDDSKLEEGIPKPQPKAYIPPVTAY